MSQKLYSILNAQQDDAPVVILSDNNFKEYTDNLELTGIITPIEQEQQQDVDNN
jgi:hypothetical protein